MAYRVRFEGPTLVIKFSETLMPADLDGVIGEVLAVEDGGTNTPPRLIDLRGITDAGIGYAEMAQLAQRAIERPLAARVRTAMLVAQPVQLGFARMFQILNQHPKVTVHIFHDETAARAWLADDIDPTASH